MILTSQNTTGVGLENVLNCKNKIIVKHLKFSILIGTNLEYDYCKRNILPNVTTKTSYKFKLSIKRITSAFGFLRSLLTSVTTLYSWVQGLIPSGRSEFFSTSPLITHFYSYSRFKFSI